MDLSKSAINKKYDQLMSQLKSGDLSQKQFKTAADRLYKLYHSDANKAQRAKDAKPAVKKTTKATSSTQQAKKPAKPTSKVRKTAEAQALERRRSRMTSEAKALDTKRARRVLNRPATGAMANQVDKNNAKKALNKAGKPKKTGRASMPYAGKFPGEPDKEEKKKKPRNLGKGSFRNLYK